MVFYEMKKIFSKSSSKAALVFLGFALCLIIYFAMGEVSYVNPEGEGTKGIAAARHLEKEKEKWKGTLTTERLQQVIRENNKVNQSPQAKSENTKENDQAFSRKQGFSDIRELLNKAFTGFQEYDYFRADTLTEEEAGQFYKKRTENLKAWLAEEGGGADQFTKTEKEFLVNQYKSLETPWYYESSDGFDAWFTWSPTICMLVVLTVGFLVSGIFSCEKRYRAASVYFASYHGRKKAVLAKIKAGVLTATLVYWGIMLLYSAVVLGCLGLQGSQCVIQTQFGKWKSFYAMTIGQEYAYILLGGYIGCLFFTLLTMLISSWSHSGTAAVIVPFALILAPSFLAETQIPFVDKILGLLPDQLLQVELVISHFALYSLGGKIIGALPVLLVLYSVLCAGLLPVVYRIYRRKEVRE